MTKMKLLTRGLLGATALTIFSASNAFAGGTAAGTSVENTFTLTYKVATVAQSAINNTASPTEFTVDRLVDLTVASNGDTTVAPGALNQKLVFTVTNKGNDKQAYSFALVNETGDQFNTTGLNINYIIDNGTGSVCDTTDLSGTMTAYTPGSGTASTDLLADGVICMVIDGDIPAARVDTDTSDITLIAKTLQPTTGDTPGAIVIADTGGNTLTGVAENVLADGTGTANEVANAGDHSDTGAYVVASANLSATKTVTIFSQAGTGCSTIPGTAPSGDQYAIPGACVQYIIKTINGGATASATSIVISDTLPDDLQFKNATQSGFTGGTFSQPTADTDCDSSACKVKLDGASLSAGSTGTVTIRALIKP